MYTDDWTEKQLRELERSLAGIYREASADLRTKVDQYWNGWAETIKENGETKVIHHAGFRERYEKEYQAYKEGKYTKEEFEAWCRAQVARGQRWEAMRDQMAERLTNTNVIAADYINNDIPRIFAENANYEAFKIEQITGRTSFTLVNEDAVKRLSQGGVLILPRMGIGITKDQAWNAQKLQNSLLQGILQGESIGKIADRFQAVSNMNRSAAIRNARTAVTGAQNAGRQNTMGRARDMGIELQKEWKATEDARTRESHARLDGVRVELDDTFPNGCRWPGDPLGAPEEVYNCRCVMKTIYPRYNGEPRLAKYYDPVSGEYKERYNTVDTYNKWKEEKAEKGLWYNEKDIVAVNEVGSQNRLKDVLLSETDTRREQYGYSSFSARRVVNSELKMYVSDSMDMRKKELHFVESNMRRAAASLGIDKEKLPVVIIAKESETKAGIIASYNAALNRLIISEYGLSKESILSAQNEMACPNKTVSTFTHELVHFLQREEYVQKYGEPKTEKEYLQKLRLMCRQQVENLEEKGYNISEISKYAISRALLGHYDETMAEYRTMKALR